MSDQLQLAITIPEPTAPDEEIAEFAKLHLGLMGGELAQAKQLVQNAFHRGVHVGKACVAVGDKMGVDRFKEWAKENIPFNYYLVYKCTTWALGGGEKLKDSAKAKQLLIAYEEEPAPKITPRKTDAFRFSNLLECFNGIRRWYRGGDVLDGMDKDTLWDLWERTVHVREFLKNIQTRLEAK